MTSDREKERFLQAIAEDRYDQSLRLVFADWLEEHGLDDEALVQRQWTREKQEAEDWLRDFAERCGQTADPAKYARRGVSYEDYGWRPITYEDVVQAGHDWLDRREWFYQIGEETARNEMYDENTQKLFWKHWRTITGRKDDGLYGQAKWDEHDAVEGSVFGCSC